MKIVDYVVSNYADAYAWDYIGFTPDQVYANEGLQVALGMKMWGFADVNTTTKILTANYSGNTWNLNYEYPSQADYADEIMLCYNNDYRAAFLLNQSMAPMCTNRKNCISSSIGGRLIRK
jgi:hypothetical protein